MNKKQAIRLTESDLKQIVKESVNIVLSENYLVRSVADEVLNYSGLYDVIENLKNIESNGNDAYSQFAIQLAKALERFVDNWKLGKRAQNIDKEYSRDDLIGMRRNRVKSHYPEKEDGEIDAINQNHFYSPLARRK